MAERRMFAKSIVECDDFLDLPFSVQALYFHLAMSADDDGLVNNPKTIIRMVGANNEDFKTLTDKKFIIPFESGVIVIRHWKVHNYIQRDRYKPTVFTAEKAQLSLENNVYTLCIQGVSIGKDRIGEDRIGEGNCIQNGYNTNAPALSKFGSYENVRLSQTAYDDLVNTYGKDLTEDYINRVDVHCQKTGTKYSDYHAVIVDWVTKDGAALPQKDCETICKELTAEQLAGIRAFRNGGNVNV